MRAQLAREIKRTLSMSFLAGFLIGGAVMGVIWFIVYARWWCAAGQ
jgi:hypothetical protein